MNLVRRKGEGKRDPPPVAHKQSESEQTKQDQAADTDQGDEA